MINPIPTSSSSVSLLPPLSVRIEDTEKDHLAQPASFLFGCSEFCLPVWITPSPHSYFRNQSRCLLNSFIPFVSTAFSSNFFHMLISLPYNGVFSHQKWPDWTARKNSLLKYVTKCFSIYQTTFHYFG